MSADVSSTPNKSTNNKASQKSKSVNNSKKNPTKQSDPMDESETINSSQTDEEETEDTAGSESLNSDSDMTETQEKPEKISKAKKQAAEMVDIADSPIVDQTTVAAAVETDKPLSSNIQNTEADNHAKASLEIADNHRNQRTHFSPIESWREALRLYKEVVTSPLDISPDLKARAAINLVEMKVWSAYEKISISDKIDAFQSIIEITKNKIYSADVRGWAKRHLAKLYILGDFDFEPVQAKKQALELYNEIIADSALSNETRARAMIQLAHHYVSLTFDVSDKDALEKATKLLTDVFENQDVRDGLRAEAKILLASITNPYNDSKNERRLKLLREIESDPKVPATEKAKAKRETRTLLFAKYF